MGQAKDLEITEFHTLIAEIRAQTDLLKETILTEDEKQEWNKILTDFDNSILNQVYGTLYHLSKYQLEGWRELIDGEGDGEKASPGTSACGGPSVSQR
ncbi:MAG TPA: hypothetical protein VHR42_05060 [Clostridia bacterium]|nr:hypothetical protein [Clostridia bacterium]